MKKTSVLALATVFLLASVCFAGERNMIRNFDKNGLKDLNNQLKKQEKLIKKLQKQLGQSGASTTTVQSTEDFVSETVLDNAGTVINTVPAVGVAREDGRLELYDTSIDEATVINVEPSSYVHETQAKIAVPSSYFLDLRGVRATTVTMQYTADYLTLHNAAGETLALTNVSETNNINTAGPVAGGRDQVGAFGDWVWVHFFIIYNPTTGDVSSLSSLSPTAPTLPTGYTYFVRVGCNLKTNAGKLRAAWQIGDRFYHGDITSPIFEAAPDLADISQSLDISNHIPTTAKVVHGTIGTSSALPGMVGVGVSAGASSIEISFSLASGDAVYGLTGAEFTLPVLTTQTIWWRAHTTDAIYAMSITGFQDDL